MESQLAERLKSKSVKNAIIGRITEDFNLTPLLAEAYFNQIKDYLLEYTALCLESGQIHYRSAELTTKPGYRRPGTGRQARGSVLEGFC
ncbi:MAG: hypothetical protein ACETWG_04055 [Candidatus Neomarinimicrobiota bacterium]